MFEKSSHLNYFMRNNLKTSGGAKTSKSTEHTVQVLDSRNLQVFLSLNENNTLHRKYLVLEDLSTRTVKVFDVSI
jgi:hypothetical protein